MVINRKFFVIVGVIASVLIIFLYVFSVQMSDQQTTGTDTKKTNGYVILDSASYAQTVGGILNDLVSDFSTGDTEALAKARNKLQELRVSSEVKEDHLLLFSALDIWLNMPEQADMINKVRDRLATFADHQEWSKSPVQSLLDQLAK